MKTIGDMRAFLRTTGLVNIKDICTWKLVWSGERWKWYSTDSEDDILLNDVMLSLDDRYRDKLNWWKAEIGDMSKNLFDIKIGAVRHAISGPVVIFHTDGNRFNIVSFDPHLPEEADAIMARLTMDGIR